ncbi:uncharacterized protein LOC134816132 isoform X2 [Bolinopsis microptera]|uniref:uncharacterized protein LOC134816132 isoform X2 n=1 Tax=Bolinopsis microptera TaxID=2820187 RepID=UPI003078C8C5
MEIRVAVLCVISHVILSADLNRNTTEYLGCYERFDDYSEFGWETSTIQPTYEQSTAALFKECLKEARVKGWKAFIVDEKRSKTSCGSCLGSCLGSRSPTELLRKGDASFDCVSSWLDGQWLVSGGNEGMPTYQIVEHHLAQFTEDQDPSIDCRPQTIHFFEALLFKPGPSCLEKEIVNVTTSINSSATSCHIDQCYIYDYDYDVGGCSYERLNITYGCLYDRPSTVDSEATDWAVALSKNIRFIIFALVVIIVPISCWCRRKSYLHRYPQIRGCCWSLHQSCPCLDLYPSDATDPHSMFGGEVHVNVQPVSMMGGAYPPSATGGAYPPPATGGAYPPPATGGAYPPPATGGAYPPPATGGAYPPPATGGAYPPPATGGAYPPGDEIPPPYDPSAAPTGGANLPPPPSYTDANTSGGGTTGGWFAKLNR